jgi:hypothetical protein
MTFDPLRRGRTNQDRRDQAFARSVIALAERRRLDAEAREALPEVERCLWCGLPFEAQTHHPYCSVQCAISAEND